MFERPTASHSLGLELEGTTLRGALLSLDSATPKIERLFSTTLSKDESGSFQQATPLASATSHLPKNMLSEALIVTGLNQDEVLVRPLEIKLAKAKDVDAVLPFQAEPLLPFALDNAVLDRQFLSMEEGTTQLTIFAA